MTTLTKPSIQQFRHLSPLDWGYEYEGWTTHRFFCEYDENENEIYPFGFLEDVEAKLADENVLTEKDVNEDLKKWFGFTDDEIKQLWDEDVIRIENYAVEIVYRSRGEISRKARLVEGFSNPQIQWMYDHDDCESLNADKRIYSIDMLADVWQDFLWESFAFDPDKHKDDDDLPWTDEDISWYKKVSLIGHYNHCYGTKFDEDDVKEDDWEVGNSGYEICWFIAPLEKSGGN